MKHYNQLCGAICKVVIAFCALLMFVLLCCSALQVISRYAFGSSITWTEEASRYCFIWLDMLGAAILVYKGGHAVVDLIAQKFHGTAQKIYQTIIYMMVFYVGAILARYGFELAQLTFDQTSPSLKLPMGLVYGVVAVCGALVVFFAVNLILNIWLRRDQSIEEGTI